MGTVQDMVHFQMMKPLIGATVAGQSPAGVVLPGVSGPEAGVPGWGQHLGADIAKGADEATQAKKDKEDKRAKSGVDAPAATVPSNPNAFPPTGPNPATAGAPATAANVPAANAAPATAAPSVLPDTYLAPPLPLIPPPPVMTITHAQDLGGGTTGGGGSTASPDMALDDLRNMERAGPAPDKRTWSKPTTPSDQELKTNIQPGDDKLNELMDHLGVHQYEYKDEQDGVGTFVGPMAQQLEQTTIGKSAVIDTPRGKMVDSGRLVMASLSALALHHQDLKEINKTLDYLKKSANKKKQ
jgi:hypothetical protein